MSLTEDDVKKLADAIGESMKKNMVTPPCNPLKQVISDRQSDHDLLVEMRTMLKSHLEQYDKDRLLTSNDISANKNSATAAHKRIDAVYIGGIVVFVVCVVTLYFSFARGA